ncbi:hypothetical protein BP6252_10916 [Coleophoma cylindrospora]|uniref:Mid2 domain-containing protein n=1 Tax=Coleophoma cylindrospora TaxID=1849047 RepID=A0A3D8QNS3_9HELO|nr:hypothetical protein BP6252_10916 [Coleophoma cylindrospora]
MAANPTTVADLSSTPTFNRGALTTPFTTPSSCLDFYTTMDQGTFYFGHYSTNDFDPSCYPPGQQTNWDIYYYSPATICPPGWTNITTFSASFPGHSNTMLTLSPETTAVLCCPLGFSYISSIGIGHKCQAITEYPATYVTVSTAPDSVYPVTTDDGPYSSYYSATIVGDGIPIWYQSKDLPVPTTPNTSPATTGSQPSMSSSSPTTSVIPSSSPTSQSSGLSTGAKIGLGVAIPTVTIAFILGFILYIRYYRHRPTPFHVQSTDQ